MYGLNKNSDLSFLLEKQLYRVSVGLYHVELNFNHEISIYMECQFHHILNGKSQTLSEDLPSSASSLLQLIGSTIVKVKNHGNGNIEIIFSNQHTLKIFDNNKSYESYKISGPSIQLIV
jgi:hypothetical protein